MPIAVHTNPARSSGSNNQSQLPPSPLPASWTVADLQRHLGGIPLERILLSPPPGYATEDDVTRLADHDDRLCELEDGILVEKTVGWYESRLAGWLLTHINQFLETHKLGVALGADGTLKILPGIVKIPDVSFISWSRFPSEDLRDEPIPPLIPDLAVEVLSKSNTKPEMDARLVKYFQAGVRLVWYIDPKKRWARVYRSPNDLKEIDEKGTLDGGDVLPGFRIRLKALFDRADEGRPSEVKGGKTAATRPKARRKKQHRRA
jgi:Uma2 family endonuclease